MQWPGIMLSQNMNILWQEIFFNSDVRQWSHPLMIPLHCLWAKSSNRTSGQFECDVTFFCFAFFFLIFFIYMHGAVVVHDASCCSIVCLRFEVMQIQQVDCKMSTKKNLKNIFLYFWTTAHTRIYSYEKVDSELSSQSWPQRIFSL